MVQGEVSSGSVILSVNLWDVVTSAMCIQDVGSAFFPQMWKVSHLSPHLDSALVV